LRAGGETVDQRSKKVGGPKGLECLPNSEKGAWLAVAIRGEKYGCLRGREQGAGDFMGTRWKYSPQQQRL